MLCEVAPTSGLPLRVSDFWTHSGDAVEESLKRLFGLSSAHLVCSGTAAFWVLLSTLHELTGRKTVIIPGYSCPLVVRAVRSLNLDLELCDTAPDSFDFDFGKLSSLCGPDTLCVVSTHLAGIAADTAAARKIASAAGAYAMEDAAQAMGAKVEGVPVGTAGDCSFFSLAAGKGLTIFEGGVFSSRVPEIFSRACQIADRIPVNRLFELYRVLQLLGYAVLYNPRGLRFVYGAPLRRALARGDEIRAVQDYFSAEIPLHRVSRLRRQVAANAVQRLAEHLEENRLRAAQRIPRLEEVPGARLLKPPHFEDGTYPFFILLFERAELAAAALQKLWGAGLGVTKSFVRALSDYDYLAADVPASDLPNARSFAARSITISNSAMLTDGLFEQVLAELSA